MHQDLIPVAIPMTGEEEAAAVREVILSGQFVSGQRTREFEERFAAWNGTAYGCALNSGTAALHVALAVLGVGPGDEVIVPPLTFFSTVAAVLHQNAIPIFADIDPATFQISATDIARVVTPHTRAIIPVHLFGGAADMDAIMALAERHGLAVVEDCAQAHGTEFNGRRVGSIGHMGAFSFYATKHMTTGEGGMLVTGDEALARAARSVRSHGMEGRDDHVRLGYNYRMNEIAAALGLVQLAKVDGFNDKRIANSLYLLETLGREAGKWFSVPRLDPRVRHTFFWCPLRVRVEAGFDPQDAAARLRERGVEVRRRYREPLYRQKVLAAGAPYPGGCPFSCRGGAVPHYASLRLPGVESVAGTLLGLPNHPGLDRNHLDRIVETVLTLY